MCLCQCVGECCAGEEVGEEAGDGRPFICFLFCCLSAGRCGALRCSAVLWGRLRCCCQETCRRKPTYVFGLHHGPLLRRRALSGFPSQALALHALFSPRPAGLMWLAAAMINAQRRQRAHAVVGGFGVGWQRGVLGQSAARTSSLFVVVVDGARDRAGDLLGRDRKRSPRCARAREGDQRTTPSPLPSPPPCLSPPPRRRNGEGTGRWAAEERTNRTIRLGWRCMATTAVPIAARGRASLASLEPRTTIGPSIEGDWLAGDKQRRWLLLSAGGEGT